MSKIIYICMYYYDLKWQRMIDNSINNTHTQGWIILNK